MKLIFFFRTNPNFIFFAYCLSLFILFNSCAIQQPPTGGKKDITPPKLIKSSPTDKSLNFKGKEIMLVFDEYIDIDPLIKQQLIITPNIEDFSYKPIKRGILISFEKTLLPNTTYTFNFRRAIKDLNEKNPARNLKLVFSTGNFIDSLKINGLVKDAENNKPTIDALVSLYKITDTLDITKQKPFYFTKTDSSGRYLFENLQAGEYKIYALTDGNNNLTYQERAEKIGFNDTTLVLKDSSVTGQNFAINRSDQTPPRIAGRGSEENYATLEFSEGIVSAKIEFQHTSEKIPYNLSSDKTLLFYNTIQKFDSIPMKITVEDSSGNILERDIRFKFATQKKDRKEKDKPEKLKFETKLSLSSGGKILKDFEIKITFNKPIQSFKPQQLSLLADTLNKIELTEKDTSWNIFRTEFILKKRVNIRESLRLSIEKGTFMSVEGDSSAKVKNDYLLKSEEDYGVIGGTIIINTDESFVIQLLTSDYKLVAEQTNTRNFRFTFIEQGQYLLKLILDKNKNGRWDGGDFKRRTIPEKVYFKGPIPMKQNFEMLENNFDIQ